MIKNRYLVSMYYTVTDLRVAHRRRLEDDVGCGLVLARLGHGNAGVELHLLRVGRGRLHLGFFGALGGAHGGSLGHLLREDGLGALVDRSKALLELHAARLQGCRLRLALQLHFRGAHRRGLRSLFLAGVLCAQLDGGGAGFEGRLLQVQLRINNLLVCLSLRGRAHIGRPSDFLLEDRGFSLGGKGEARGEGVAPGLGLGCVARCLLRDLGRAHRSSFGNDRPFGGLRALLGALEARVQGGLASGGALGLAPAHLLGLVGGTHLGGLARLGRAALEATLQGGRHTHL